MTDKRNERTTLSRIAESPKIKTAKNKMQKLRPVIVGNRWLFAVQLHLSLKGFVGFIACCRDFLNPVWLGTFCKG